MHVFSLCVELLRFPVVGLCLFALMDSFSHTCRFQMDQGQNLSPVPASTVLLCSACILPVSQLSSSSLFFCIFQAIVFTFITTCILCYPLS